MAHISYVMQHILYLTHVVSPRKSESEGVEASVLDAESSQNVADPKQTSSPGVKTRSVSLSPTSPGPTTRRMASISPGGINRRLIIS